MIVYEVMECMPPRRPVIYVYAKFFCLVHDRITLLIGIPMNLDAMSALIRIIRNIVEKIIR